MKRPLLLLDCHALAWRAFHTMGHLSFGDIKTGVIFGFLKEVVSLLEEFEPAAVVFAFEGHGSKRKEIFPAYKFKRHNRELSEEEAQVLGHFRGQIKMLRECYLDKIGFKNVIWQDGYESDDIIARYTKALVPEVDAVIVSEDGDFWQLLKPNVSIYSPKTHKLLTMQGFFQRTGLPQPTRWAQVLALAGCNSDEVPGIPTVGKKTAISYVLGKLKPTSAKFKAIESEEGQKIVARNKRLVKLPFEGTKLPQLLSDDISEEGWRWVCDELGMKSIRDEHWIFKRAKRYSQSV